jgi:hypothetical protein
VIQAPAARRKTLFSYFERHSCEQKYCVSPFALIGSANSSAKCIPQTGSLTRRLPRTAGSFGVAECPPGSAGWLAALNNRPTNLITQDTINTQNTNLIRRPKKPITIAALACAFSSCELKSTTSLIRRGEPSVCKHKSTRQTKLCDFNRLRGAMGTPEKTLRSADSI